MREIKFRMWDSHLKQMFIPQQLDNPYSLGKLGFELMQYVGLHDKNNKEIYEGDFIKRLGYGIDNDLGVVKFIRGCFVVQFNFNGHIENLNTSLKDYNDLLIKDESLEILGNIYENPDLLKSLKGGEES